MNKTITLSLLSSLLLSNVYAAPIELEEVTIEAANRTKQTLKDLSESVTIITAEDIKEARVTTLNDALIRLGNISMISNGGRGQNSSFFLRGMDTSKTLVLIDGMRYNDVSSASGAQFSHIYLSNVQRIEIIKGAQSGIWGSDASAGVINIVTKQAENGLHLDANAQVGSFNTQEGSLQVSYKKDLFDISLGVSRLKTEGFSAAEPNQSSIDYGKRGSELGYEKDAHTNNTYNAKLGINITDQDRIEANFRRINSFTEFDASTYNATTESYDSLDAQNYVTTTWGVSKNLEEIDNRFYSASYTHTDEINQLTAQYNHSSFNRKVYDFSGTIKETSIQDRINYMDNSFLRLGGSYQEFNHEKNYGADFNKGYTNKALYLTNYNKSSLIETLGNTIFSQSLRSDNYSAFDNKITGKLGLKQFVYEDIYLSLNYATGYNAPSLYQLYAPSFLDWVTGLPIPVGNETLSPEETASYDVSLGNDEFTLTYFHNEIEDLIQYDPVLGYQNVSGASKIKGVEIGYKDNFFDLISLNMNYTYLNAKNADGEFLLSRPKHQIDANAFYYIDESLNIGLNAQYLGERYDKDGKQGAQTGKYTVFNSVINYTINENFTIYAKIDNISDKYYQVRDGYATAERSYYAGLNAKF